MTSLRCLLATLALAVALAVPASAGAVVVGLADQKAASFTDARVLALGVRHARLIVPWDAATSEPAAVDAWLATVRAAGMEPHVAFEHLRSDACPGPPCVVPTRAQYGAAVRRFVARFPSVRTYTTWNEANHQSQPVSDRPEAVAGYYAELRDACPGCTVVAGDVLDSGSYVRWLERFLAASPDPPQLWGLHNYGDVTYARTTGVDSVLATVPGDLWIEETGGLLTLRNAAGRLTYSANEAQAAAAVDRAFAIAATRPRITRMYVYQWIAKPLDRFDAGLVRPDGTARPSLDAFARGVAGQGSTAATQAATTTAKATWSATWSKAAPRRVLVRLRCPAALGTCAGRATATLRLRTRTAKGAVRFTRVKLGVRRYATTTARRTVTLRYTVSRSARRRARAATSRRVDLALVPTRPAGAAKVARAALARPKA